MGTPKATFRKVDGQTGVVRPAPTGILAIVSTAMAGLFSAGAFADETALETEYSQGRLREFGELVMAKTKKSIVSVRVDQSTAGGYGTITKTGGGTSAITAGSTEPCDEFPSVVVDFPVAGTIGTSGIKWRYSFDGGKTFSKPSALGVATSLTIPNTGISLALGTGTVTTTTKVSFSTTPPLITNTDLPTALEALRLTSSPYECVLIDMDADETTVGLVDTWILEQNKRGKYPTVVLTCRRRDAESETEAEYKDAIDTMLESAVSLDIVLCADLVDLVSPIRGILMPRPTALAVAALGMSIRLGTDAAYVALGALPWGAKITDTRGNPKYHNENVYPGLDDLRVTTLRLIDGFEGVYVTNAKLLSPSGSDYVFWQHARTINRACEIGYQILTKQLSKGVKKSRTVGPNGERYIDEAEAQHLEELANAQMFLELKAPGEVDDVRLTLSRTDDIRSNAGAKIRGRIECVSLAYAKEFDIDVGFVTAITQPDANQGQ